MKVRVLFFLKSIINIPKNLIKLKFKDYFFYLFMIVIILYIWRQILNLTKLFSVPKINIINFIGNELIKTNNNIYFIISFYVFSF